MSVVMTSEIRQALGEEEDGPLEVIDPESNRVYILLPKERYEQILGGTDFNPREMYPLIARTAGDAGWNDPAMDAYDTYEGHSAKGEAR